MPAAETAASGNKIATVGTMQAWLIIYITQIGSINLFSHNLTADAIWADFHNVLRNNIDCHVYRLKIMLNLESST